MLIIYLFFFINIAIKIIINLSYWYRIRNSQIWPLGNILWILFNLLKSYIERGRGNFSYYSWMFLLHWYMYQNYSHCEYILQLVCGQLKVRFVSEWMTFFFVIRNCVMLVDEKVRILFSTEFVDWPRGKTRFENHRKFCVKTDI